MAVFLPGGAGYIGSHTAVELIRAGYDVIIADNYENSSPVVLDRIRRITGKQPVHYEADVRDKDAVEHIFAENQIDAVIHFAGLKAVGESVLQPLRYYRNNLDTTLTLLEVMGEYGCRNFIFSSSATIYGEDARVPYVESMGRGKCTNPYGWTKNMIEQILVDAANADSELSVVLLRYFNPIGADPSGLIGEDPQGIPNNLMPFISRVAAGKLDHLTVFGKDYPTPDGTCLRDYIHVSDLAVGHVRAIDYASSHKGAEAFNLGTGTPYSVMDILHTFEKVNEVSIPFRIGDRRAGDIPECWSDAGKAGRVLGWKAVRSLEEMCRDAWNWQKNNPDGYRTAVSAELKTENCSEGSCEGPSAV